MIEACEFCGSTRTPIKPQDMGEGRIMRLCARCRQFIEDGEHEWAERMAHTPGTMPILMGENEDASEAWRDCPHRDAVFWNPYNQVVQCHRCGLIFEPSRYDDALPGQIGRQRAQALSILHQTYILGLDPHGEHISARARALLAAAEPKPEE